MTMNSVLYNPDTLTERDRAFLAERRHSVAQGYRPLKRIFVDDEQVESNRAKWMLKDRQHLAQWRLRMKKKEAADKERTLNRASKNAVEYNSRLVNWEYESLERAFWAEAPVMLVSQRRHWWKGRWPEFYWTHTALKETVLGLENRDSLWFDVPEIPRYIMSKTCLLMN